MQYEYHLFDKIFQEFSKPFVLLEKDFSFYKKAILQYHDSVYNVIVGNFKRTNEGLILQHKKTVCSLHPEIEKINDLQTSIFQDNISEVLTAKSLKLLGVRKTEILNWSINNKINYSIIYIKIKSTTDNLKPAEAIYYYHHLILKDEVARIRKTISDQVHQLVSSEAIEQYIHVQQQALINLSYSILKTLGPIKEQDIYKPASIYNETELLYLLFISIERLLRFLEKNYLKYIDKTIRIPYRSALVKSYDLHTKLANVKDGILNSVIDGGLKKVLLNYFIGLGDVTLQGNISYKELIYANTFLSAFHEALLENDSSISEATVKNILFEFNFNSLSLFEYKIKQITIELNAYEIDDPQRVDILFHWLKTINQRQSNLLIAFKPGRPSLKDQINGWLDEEIAYMHKKNRVQYIPPQRHLFSHEEPPKLKLGVTIAQISYFYRLLKEVGIITHKNQRDIFRHIAASYYTTNASEISVDSVGSKFYNNEEADIEAIRTLVIAMLNKLRHNVY